MSFGMGLCMDDVLQPIDNPTTYISLDQALVLSLGPSQDVAIAQETFKLYHDLARTLKRPFMYGWFL